MTFSRDGKIPWTFGCDKSFYQNRCKSLIWIFFWHGPYTCPFACSLAPLTCSLAPDCSLHSHPPLRSLVRSLAHFAHSLARGTVNDWMAILSVFFSIFDHSVFPIPFRLPFCLNLARFLSPRLCTVVQNSLILRHQNFHFPTSLGVSEVSEVSERANE